ncbi:hypothetical protein D3C72_2518260 [compost metagenome]
MRAIAGHDASKQSVAWSVAIAPFLLAGCHRFLKVTVTHYLAPILWVGLKQSIYYLWG